MRRNPDITTTVELLGEGVAKIRKTVETGAETSALVVTTGTFVFVVSRSTRVREQLHVSYLRLYEDSEEAYQKWLHLIGKLSIKGWTSKYFNEPIYEEHLVNGNSLSTRDRKIAESLAAQYDTSYR